MPFALLRGEEKQSRKPGALFASTVDVEIYFEQDKNADFDRLFLKALNTSLLSQLLAVTDGIYVFGFGSGLGGLHTEAFS